MVFQWYEIWYRSEWNPPGRVLRSQGGGAILGPSNDFLRKLRQVTATATATDTATAVTES